jgi:Lipase (class 3)
MMLGLTALRTSRPQADPSTDKEGSEMLRTFGASALLFIIAVLCADQLEAKPAPQLDPKFSLDGFALGKGDAFVKWHVAIDYRLGTKSTWKRLANARSPAKGSAFNFRSCRTTPMKVTYGKIPKLFAPKRYELKLCPEGSPVSSVRVYVRYFWLGWHEVDAGRHAVRKANPAPALYEDARFVKAAYAMSGEFEQHGSRTDGVNAAVRKSFPAKELSLVGVIMGDPVWGKAPRALYGFVADEKGEDKRLFVMRGTASKADAIKDMSKKMVPFARGKIGRDRGIFVHKGFYGIYRSLRLYRPGEAQPTADLCAAFGADRRPVIVGHSLGSSLANLLAVDCAYNGKGEAGKITLITLASPRTGNRAFQKAADKVGTIRRVFNGADLVTWAPQESDGYLHIGTDLAYSSFFYKKLRNDLKGRQQIGCWHSADIYLWFLNPAHTGRGNTRCWR